MNTTPTLTGPEKAPKSGKKAESLVILLHGLGADGNDLIGLAPLLAEALPNTHFISPNAPQPCDMAPYGYQWFSLREWTQESMIRGADATAPLLHQFADSQLQRFGLPESKLAWVGFSQGTMMSLKVALFRQRECAGVVGFSGTVVMREITCRPPVCLIHGDADMVVPFAAMSFAEKALKEASVPVETHRRFGLGHGIDPEGLDIAASFLKAHLL